MPSPFDRATHDLGVHSVPPARPTDPRVRLAEEDSLQSQIGQWLVSQSRRSEWTEPLNLSLGSDRVLTVQGKYRSKIYPTDLAINTSAAIPALSDAAALVRQEERLYLVVFGTIVGGDQDALLGQVTVGAASPKAVQVSKEEQVKAVLAPFGRDRGFTPSAISIIDL